MAGAIDSNFQHEKWSSETVFLLATIGGAVGLGNLWRFPFMAGQNGGGAFVIIYIAFVILLCLPLVIAELAIGRQGRLSPVATMKKLTAEVHGSSFWHVVGWISVLLPVLAMSYYAVIAGWSMDYVYQAAVDSFTDITGAESGAAFNAMVGSPMRVLILHALFISMGVFIVARGVGKGIEVLMRYMMPALLVMLVLLAMNSIFRSDIGAGLSFLFDADFSKITIEVVIMALGQAFFSIAVGVGMLMTYGAYLPQEISLGRAAVMIVTADTIVAMLAGIVIFPIVFQHGLDPADGPGLVFVTLPVAFGNMPGGYFVGLIFFVMLFFAAFSTVIAMIEPAVCWLSEFKNATRARMAVAVGIAGWVVGLGAALSFNVLSDVRLIESIPMLADKNIFELVDFLCSSIGIPFNAAVMAMFAGWVMTRQSLVDQMDIQSDFLRQYVFFTLRYIAPVVILAILVHGLLGETLA